MTISVCSVTLGTKDKHQPKKDKGLEKLQVHKVRLERQLPVIRLQPKWGGKGAQGLALRRLLLRRVPLRKVLQVLQRMVLLRMLVKDSREKEKLPKMRVPITNFG